MAVDSNEISKTEQEVYDLWVGENLLPSQIAIRRKTSISIIYRHIRNLKAKGYTKSEKFIGSKSIGHVSSNLKKQKNKLWRYHGLHFTIEPYYFYPRYKKHIGKINVPNGKWLVSVHENMIEFRLKKNHNIKHVDRWQCIRDTRDAFNKTLYYVSQDYGFEYIKDRKSCITCVNGHLAQTDSDIAETRKGKHLLLYGDDGKSWFEIDFSETFEHEYRHPKRHVGDADRIEKHFNIMRKKGILNLEELQELMSDMAKAQVQTQKELNLIAQSVQTNTVAMKSLVDTLKLIIPKQEIKESGISEIDKKLTQYIG